MEMEVSIKLVSLLSLAFLSALQWRHLHSVATAFAPSLDQLVSKSAMALVCNAILFFVIRDSGLLAPRCMASTAWNDGALEAKNAVNDGGKSDRFCPGQDSHELFRAPLSSALEVEREEVVKEIVLVEEKSGNFDVSDQGTMEEEIVVGEELEHEDVDEMNKKFEEFIANMRTTMQMESMQLVVKV